MEFQTENLESMDFSGRCCSASQFDPSVHVRDVRVDCSALLGRRGSGARGEKNSGERDSS